MWVSTKTFDHNTGLSCAFRQWRATHSHCSLLHGYALSVQLIFESDSLDERNWVMDFGGLKEFKAWLVQTFDHTTVIAQDDPELETFKQLHEKKIIDLKILPAVGCEKFAELIYDKATSLLLQGQSRIRLRSVEVREHSGNSARYEQDQ